AARERDLLGFVDHSHAAAADLADEAEVAQRARCRRRLARVVVVELLGRATDEVERGERRRELLAHVGVRREERVALERVPGADGREVRLQELGHPRVAVLYGVLHRLSSNTAPSLWH